MHLAEVHLFRRAANRTHSGILIVAGGKNNCRYTATIRVRVIDDRFEGKSIEEREALVLPLFKKLPKKMRDDVLLLPTLAPSEQETSSSQSLMNLEFEQPLPSRL